MNMCVKLLQWFTNFLIKSLLFTKEKKFIVKIMNYKNHLLENSKNV